MSAKTDNFINTLAPIAQNEFNSRDKWILPSVCIAQAAIESGWNLEARTLFGIKGEGFKATTSEYYNGHYEVIEDSFRLYPNVSAAVVGYYDLITTAPWFDDACNTYDYREAVRGLQHDETGLIYATSPTYEANVIKIIEDYNLTRFDVRQAAEPIKETSIDIEAYAMRTIRGDFGNGQDRINNFCKLGFSDNIINSIQSRVNELLAPVEAPRQCEVLYYIGKPIRIRENATDLNSGEYFADWVYNSEYEIFEIQDRGIVFGRDGVVTGVVSRENIIL